MHWTRALQHWFGAGACRGHDAMIGTCQGSSRGRRCGASEGGAALPSVEVTCIRTGRHRSRAWGVCGVTRHVRSQLSCSHTGNCSDCSDCISSGVFCVLGYCGGRKLEMCTWGRSLFSILTAKKRSQCGCAIYYIGPCTRLGICTRPNPPVDIRPCATRGPAPGIRTLQRKTTPATSDLRDASGGRALFPLCLL